LVVNLNLRIFQRTNLKAPQSLLTFGVINNTIITQTLAFQKSKKKKEKRKKRKEIKESKNPTIQKSKKKSKKIPSKAESFPYNPTSPLALTELT
jgi:hypothetical protein